MLKKQNKGKNTFGRVMTFRYLLALGLLAILAVWAYFILLNGINLMKTDATVVNISGRQRMLSQRIEHLAMHLVVAAGDEKQITEVRQDLIKAIKLMEESHQGLLYGDPKMNLPGKPSAKIKALYFEAPLSLDKQVREFISRAISVLKAPASEISLNNPDISYLLRAAHEDLLIALDKGVEEYESESVGHIANLQKTEIVLLFIGILVLLIMAVSIFRPLAHRVQGEIDKTKAAEESLRISNQNLEGIIRAAPLAIISIDPQGKVKEWNTAAERMFGWAKNEVLGKSIPTVPEDGLSEHVKLRERVLKGEVLSGVEVKRRKKDGSIINTSLSVSPLYDIAGNISGMMGIIEDITERKYAQDALMVSEARLRLLVETVPDCICSISFSGKYISMNTSGRLINDIDNLEEIIGTSYTEKVVERRQELEAALREAGQGKAVSVQYKSITKKGREVWWDTKLTAIRNANGYVESILGVCRDITVAKQAQEALKVSEEYFRSLVENMPDCVCRIDFDGKIITMNKAGCLIEGFDKPEDALGYLRADHVVSDNRQALEEAMRAAAAGETVSVQYKAVNLKGKEIWWDSRLTPLRDAKGNITSVLRVSRNITEDIAAQERQKNIVSGLRTIMAIADKLILSADTDSLLKSAVEEARSKFQLERCAIFLEEDGIMCGTYGTDRNGNTTDERNHKFPKDIAWKKYTETIQAGEAQWFVVQEPYLEWDGVKNITLDGEGWIAITPIRSAQKVIGVFVNDAAMSRKPLDPVKQEILAVYSSLLGNIIERKHAIDLVEKSSQFDENLLKTIPFGMNIVDTEGTILYSNERLKKLVGKETTGKKCWDIYKDNKQQCEQCPLKKGMEIGKVEVLETGHALGGKIIRITHIGMMYEEKKAILEIYEDITKEREVEQRLREALAIKSEFISMVSHELRTPLTAIKEGIAIVADESAGKVNPEQKNFLTIAERNVQRLARFINNVLDYQKLDSGRMEFYIKSGNINDTVKEVKDDMLFQADTKGLKLELELADNLPLVTFDKDKITQVLSNLLHNAIKFTESGSVKIATEKIDDIIRVSVSDTGIGIKKEDMRRLFQDFSQLATGKERKTGSTGLGLAIARRLIVHHGGQIWCESEFGKGTTFYFTLPIKQV